MWSYTPWPPTAEAALSPNRGPTSTPIAIRTPAVARREDEMKILVVRVPLPVPLKKKVPVSRGGLRGPKPGSGPPNLNFFAGDRE